MAKNRYERSKRPAKPATKRQMELLIIKRAQEFCREFCATDGWSKKCERKAVLLNASVEHYIARKFAASDENASIACHGCQQFVPIAWKYCAHCGVQARKQTGGAVLSGVPYPDHCIDATRCAGRGSCPRNPSCVE